MRIRNCDVHQRAIFATDTDGKVKPIPWGREAEVSLGEGQALIRNGSAVSLEAQSVPMHTQAFDEVINAL